MPARARMLLAALGVSVGLPGGAHAVRIAGITMPDTFRAGDTPLVLNGAGVRTKFAINIYVGGLYLEAPNANAAAILAADAPKALSMHFLRSIEKQKLVDAYKEGFEANAAQKAAAQKANVEKFYSTVTDVKEGSVTTYTYAPGTGTVVNRDGKDVATIEGKEFAEVLFSLWLGPKPPSEDLQKGLLGR